MQNFNLHTHTTRCFHAVGCDEEYVLAAIKNGIKILGFSDHCPMDQYTVYKDRMKMNELDEYIASITHLKEKYADQIQIYIGLECEYVPEYRAQYPEFLKKVDYLILGQHFNRFDQKDFTEAVSKQDLLIMKDYVLEAMKTGWFTYVAHPDYFMYLLDHYPKEGKEAVEEIAKCAAQLNIPLEINLKGKSKGKKIIDGKLDYRYPNSQTFEIIARHQAPVVYGLDCHNPKTFDDFYPYIKELKEEFKQLPLRYITHCPIEKASD